MTPREEFEKLYKVQGFICRERNRLLDSWCGFGKYIYRKRLDLFHDDLNFIGLLIYEKQKQIKKDG